MRVLLLFEYPSLSGGEKSMLAVVDYLRRTCPIEFVIMAPPWGRLANACSERGLTVCALGEQSPSRWADELLRIVQSAQPDLVHANSLALCRRLGACASTLNVSCTGHVRDIARLSGGATTHLNQLRQLVAVSEATRRNLVSQGVEAQRVTTIYNGIDANAIQAQRTTSSQSDFREALGLPHDALVALNVGQICLRKGQDVVAKAALLLRHEWPQLHWVFCGERYSAKAESATYEANLRQCFQAAGMTERVHLLGYHEEVFRVMSAADLLVHGARQEPLGRVLLEAAACRLPIVATDVGGTREIVTDGRDAWLVSADDPSALARAISTALTDRESALERAASAWTVVNERFTLQITATALWQLWDQTACRQTSFDV